MAIKIKLRRDSSTNWSSNNPILELGEPGVETDTKKIKVGDGVSTWRNLAYIQTDVSDVDFLNTSNVSEGTNLYFTNTRAVGAFTGSGNIAISSLGVISYNGTTDFVPEGSNLYFTNTRSISALTEGEGIELSSNGLITSRVFGNVFSVNGYTGDIELSTADIIEVGNVYFTNERAISSFTSGSGIFIDSNGLVTSTLTEFQQLSEPITSNVTFDSIAFQPFVTLNASDNLQSNGFFFYDHYGSNETPDIYTLSASSIAFNLNNSSQRISIIYDDGLGFQPYENASHISQDGVITIGEFASGILSGTILVNIPFGFNGNLRYTNTNNANIFANIIVKDITSI